MKKVLLSAFAGLCIIGASVATTNKTGTRIASRQTLTDTIPRDTSRLSRPDTMSPRLAFVQGNLTVTDTIPTDTTKPKMVEPGLAYGSQGNFSLRDTIPTDTTKPKMADLGVAYVR